MRDRPEIKPVKHRLTRILSGILLTASAALLVYPSFRESVSEIRQTAKIRGYAEAVTAASAGSGDMMERALLYNREIEREQELRGFSYRGEDATDPVYESMLAGGGDGVMAYIEIPKIGAFLPVAHGTRSDVLNYECGHMYGTSLPSGGASSHSVIAGHTGLLTAEIFTRLTELTEGDPFLIHLPGAVHEYEVCRILTVIPGNESRYLGVEKNRDLITLYTCTPYGINDHRLLVTGERSGTEEAASGKDIITIDSISRAAVGRAVLCALVPALAAAAQVAAGFHGKRRE